MCFITCYKGCIDDDHLNNRIENLRFLCPNCHTQTHTYANNSRYKTTCLCGRKVYKKSYKGKCINGDMDDIDVERLKNDKYKTPLYRRTKKCLQCDYPISRKSKLCEKCCKENKSKEISSTYPDIEAMISRVEEIGYSPYGRELGMSDNAIRRHLKRNGVSPLPKKNWKRKSR